MERLALSDDYLVGEFVATLYMYILLDQYLSHDTGQE
jgi:hypothetical protein